MNLVIQRDDASFKKAVRERFGKCIVCEPGECYQACYQVAHIWEFAKCDDASKYNPDNGLLLCANIHLLFDSGLLQFEPVKPYSSGMIRIRCNDTLRNSVVYRHHDKIITLLPENIPFLLRRYD